MRPHHPDQHLRARFASGATLVASVLGSVIANASAQTTHTVGVGQAYATIQAAVSVADHGDTVLVIGGVHGDSLLVTKGIRLIGQGARMTSSSDLWVPAVRVEGLPGNRSFTMRGFELLPPTPGMLTISVRSVAIINCSGPVSIEDLSVAPSGPYANWSVGLQGSAQVNVRACRVGGCSVQNSLVVIEDCHVRNRSTSLFSPMRINGGTAVLVGGEVAGGESTIATPAISLAGGQLIVTRSRLRGGPILPIQPGQPAISVTAGEVWLDPSAELLPTGPAPAVQGAVPVQREFASSIATLAPSELRLRSHGPANTWFATLLSTPVPLAPTPWGVAWVDPTMASVVVLAAYGPDRFHTFAAPLPPLPPGICVAMQPIVFATELELGVPTMLTTR